MSRDVQEQWGEVGVMRPLADEEEGVLTSLRPDDFSSYIGQETIKENLQLACRAAKGRGEPLDHVLLHGPPGLGKTSLAKVIAREMGVGCKVTSGPVIERPGDLAAILSSLQAHDILFIDEIHRMARIVEEVLYPAMEDFELDILVGQGPSARSVKVPLKPFTLIGATTRTSLLTSPLRDRFGLVFRFQFYSADELAAIVRRSASILGVTIDGDSAAALGRRSRGTPRIANRLLKRVRDFAQERTGGRIGREATEGALAMLAVDEVGLDATDRLVLATIGEKFHGGPVGIETLAAAIGEDAATLEDVFEPFLLQEGFLVRTRRGRELTERGFRHVGLVPPPAVQPSLPFSRTS